MLVLILTGPSESRKTLPLWREIKHNVTNLHATPSIFHCWELAAKHSWMSFMFFPSLKFHRCWKCSSGRSGWTQEHAEEIRQRWVCGKMAKQIDGEGVASILYARAAHWMQNDTTHATRKLQFQLAKTLIKQIPCKRQIQVHKRKSVVFFTQTLAAKTVGFVVFNKA